MIIELTRKLTATEYAIGLCAICGNDFERGSVYPAALSDAGQEIGEMCPTCLEYLGRRKLDAEDLTLENWPARGWPTVAVLNRLRMRYPEAIYDTEEDMFAAADDAAGDMRILEASRVWRMEREEAPA